MNISPVWRGLSRRSNPHMLLRWLAKIAPTMRKDQTMIICLSGRGDKDVYQVARYRGVKLNEQD